MRTSSIRLRANARLAILHEDYLEICNGNMLAAMLLSILVYWTDVKIAKKDENLWVWKSHQDFQEDLMFDKPGMKPPHRTTIKTALDLLISKKYVEWRRNPKMPLDQTRQYLVDRKAVQTAIDALPPIVVKPTMQSQNSDNGMSNNQQSLSENQQCNDEIPTSNTIDYSTEITVPEITGNVVATSAEDRNAPAPVDINKWKTDSEKRRAMFADVPLGQDIEEDISMLETRKQEATDPAVNKTLTSQTPGTGTRTSVVNPPLGDQDDSPSVQATIVSPSRDAAQRTVRASGAVQASGKRKGKVAQAKPAITLTAQEQAFWELWCSVWFNQDVPPTLNETAYGHVKTLAPHITTQEQMNSLEKYARKRLMEQSNISRREVQLGNCVSSYQSWKQTQQKTQRDDGPALGGYYYIGSVG